jgi:hypothetical protein
VLAVWTFASVAEADESQDLVAKGEELAKQGAWSQAITTFKQADAHQPRAENACFIGLAYLRRELWAQAELYFTKCHDRAKPDDPLPVWSAEAEGQLAQKLAGQNVAAVTLDVTPATVAAEITASGFLPDEKLGRGTIHLAPGHYTFTFAAPGYPTVTRELQIANKDPVVVRVKLEHEAVAFYYANTNVRWYLIGGGVALGGLGVLLDVTKVQSERDELQKSAVRWDQHSSSFETWRDVTVGCWIGGAILTGIGTYLAVQAHSDLALTARIDHQGAAFAIGWSR